MDAYEKPRIPSRYNPKDYERGLAEDRLRDTLVTLRHIFFKDKIPGHSLLSPHALWPTPLLERIVDLVHYGRLATVEDINKQLEWAYAKECGPRILDLIEEFCPVAGKASCTAKPPPSTSPFISTPLRRPLSASNTLNLHVGGPTTTPSRLNISWEPSQLTDLLGAPKDRKQTQCSACGGMGHNRRSFLQCICSEAH
ncbi:hypothetical protein ARMGADRAFT_1074825 [Armillaria gallica]|uniref:Uncharacterized protein n=1 Tax=Armillaria gallica TaxID=47427 RepID=A0A2H3E8F7_ARMGA|nr:hypothetical protein ARMGADRAFT_1074825 [Armillaria gallica]